MNILLNLLFRQFWQISHIYFGLIVVNCCYRDEGYFQTKFYTNYRFLYWDAVGYVTKPVHCLTLSQGRLADSDFGPQKAS